MPREGSHNPGGGQQEYEAPALDLLGVNEYYLQSTYNIFGT